MVFLSKPSSRPSVGHPYVRDYFSAAKLASELGASLPLHAMWDEYTSANWSVHGKVWIKEPLLASLRKGTFQKGNDLARTFRAIAPGPGLHKVLERRVIVPASELQKIHEASPDGIFGKTAVGVLFNLEGFEENGKQVTMFGNLKGTHVVYGLKSRAGWGKKDGETALPLAVSKGALALLPEGEKRNSSGFSSINFLCRGFDYVPAPLGTHSRELVESLPPHYEREVVLIKQG